jgi:hypothetical protein
MSVVISRRALQQLANDPKLRRALERAAKDAEIEIKASAPRHDPDPRRDKSYPGRPSGTLANSLNVKVVLSSAGSSGYALRLVSESEAKVLGYVRSGRSEPLIIRPRSSKKNLNFFSLKANRFVVAGTTPAPDGSLPKLQFVTAGKIAPNTWYRPILIDALRRLR